MLVAAVDLEHDPGRRHAVLLGQHDQRLEHHIDALVVDELAEEAEAVDGGANAAPVEARRGGCNWPFGMTRNFAPADPRPCSAPQGTRRGNERSHIVERRLETRRAQRQKFGPQVREAAMAAIGVAA